jgi:cell division protein FtsW
VSSGEGQLQRAHHPDYVVAIIIAVLLAIGLIIMYSVSPILSQNILGNANKNFFFLNQVKYMGVGILFWLIAANVPYTFWRKYATSGLVIAVISLFVLMVPGLSHSSHGATRWIGFGPVSVQPAEILKIAFVIYLAAWFEKHEDEVGSLFDTLIPFSIMLVVASFILVVFQRDMGTMAVLALSSIGMYFAAGLRWRHMAILAAGGTALIWASIIAFPHRISRLVTFLNPSQDASGSGYHINQALIAIGSGGILGVGLGKSIQVYGYLPEAANDSIFAIIAEEFGLIGSVAIVGLFGVLAYRGFQIARNAPDTFSRLAATGITLLLLFQSAINIGAMLSLLPLTGIPLPFISYGGTSLVISLLASGILLNISKYTVREVRDADSRQRRGNSRSHLTDSGYQRRLKVAR